MRVCIVYEAPSFSTKIHIYEFFDCLTAAKNFIDTHEYSKYLEFYSFSDSFSNEIRFIKGFYKEILIIDNKLLNYFSNILNFYEKFKKDDSIEHTFCIRLLNKSIKEVTNRLNNLRSHS